MAKTTNNELRKVLARNMRIRRAELNITQEEVAHRSGLNQAYLSDVERERRNVSIDNIEAIAEALGVSGSDLLKVRVFGSTSEP